MEHSIWSRRRARLGVLSAVAVLGTMALGGVVTRNVWAAQTDGSVANTPAPIPAGRVAALADLQDGFSAIAQRMEPSVVLIRVQKTIRTSAGPDSGGPNLQIPGFPGMQFPRTPRSFNERGAGSGVIVRSDGWILTNDHVVGGADKVTVVLEDGRQLDGTVRRDYRSDLALVKVNATGLTPAEIGDSDRVRVGQWAVAFGAPFELTDTMTVGIISALHRQTAISEGTEGRFYPSLLQTDAAINPGNSGGPLVDIQGRVIGINVAINSPNGGSVGIGFAIPSNTARDIMDQLMTKGRVTRAFLGVVPRALTPADRERYGVRTGGALIEQVSDNTPASRAGLQVEDVVTSIDGHAVADDVALRDMVARTAPGRSVTLGVRRGGKDITVNATLETVKDDVASAQPPAETASGKLGVRVEAVTADNAKRYNLGTVRTGVVVTEVQQGGAAEDAGLQPGDVLVRANGRTLQAPADLTAALGSAHSGDSVTLVVQRDNARRLVTAMIP